MNSIIVTGDSRGLGNEIVNTILDKTNYRVIGLSRSENDEIRRLNQEYPERYEHLKFDLFKSDEIRELYLNEIKELGPIYGLVNNAAFAYDDLATNADVSTLEKSFRINVISPMIFTKYAIRDMLLNGIEGSIVHISSVSTSTGYKGLSMYASTKGALESFSRGIAREWGKRGIRSNCVAPGFMETSMTSDLSEEQKDRIYKRTALKSATEQESVSDTVLFLLSEEASSITGEVIRVDSGTL